jgi:hypothetical protein
MQPLDLQIFIHKFNEKVTRYGIIWELVGFYAPDGKVYPFGTDTKVISTVFESLAAPLIKEIADEHNYTIEGADQTIYPDFTLTPPSGRPPRIAIDVKTTYRRFTPARLLQPFRYTLGSYTSFLRTPGATKNIKYPYNEYDNHWVIGYLYTRRPGSASKVYYLPAEITDLLCPFQDVEYFIQDKYKIVGLTPASGNTANIGSFPTRKIEDLRLGLGPFAAHGKETCDAYWKNFPRIHSERQYLTVEQFLRWLDSR